MKLKCNAVVNNKYYIHQMLNPKMKSFNTFNIRDCPEHNILITASHKAAQTAVCVCVRARTTTPVRHYRARTVNARMVQVAAVVYRPMRAPQSHSKHCGSSRIRRWRLVNINATNLCLQQPKSRHRTPTSGLIVTWFSASVNTTGRCCCCCHRCFDVGKNTTRLYGNYIFSYVVNNTLFWGEYYFPSKMKKICGAFAWCF